jgi:hypothetical protein
VLFDQLWVIGIPVMETIRFLLEGMMLLLRKGAPCHSVEGAGFALAKVLRHERVLEWRENVNPLRMELSRTGGGSTMRNGWIGAGKSTNEHCKRKRYTAA